jgi:hypothetical protein
MTGQPSFAAAMGKIMLEPRRIWQDLARSGTTGVCVRRGPAERSLALW